MSSQVEGHQASLPEDESNADSEAVQTRVSELLDNATVTAEDETMEPRSPDASNGEAPAAGEPMQQAEGAVSDQANSDSADGVGEDTISTIAVKIRGRPGGVMVEIDEESEWEVILKLLDERLGAAEGFFRGGRTVLEVGPREVYEDELRQARDLLSRHDMTLGVVRSTSDLTLQSSLLLGLSTSNNTAKPVESDRAMAPVVPITQPKSPYFVHNGTLRSGQILRKAESIVVVGDVNPGAKVISGGDVMVCGRLRGLVHAGANGNKRAVVAAIEFSPTQLRIAGVTAVAPDSARSSRGLKFWKKEPERRPEVANIADGRIVVEPWDDSRPGRPRIARR